jgi:hypothetical protein
MTDQADLAAMSDHELLAEWRTTKAAAQTLSDYKEPPAHPPAKHRRHEALEAEAKRRRLLD